MFYTNWAIKQNNGKPYNKDNILWKELFKTRIYIWSKYLPLYKKKPIEIELINRHNSLISFNKTYYYLLILCFKIKLSNKMLFLRHILHIFWLQNAKVNINYLINSLGLINDSLRNINSSLLIRLLTALLIVLCC